MNRAMRIIIAPVPKHGLERWAALVIDSTGKLVWQTVRWSEIGARRAADTYVHSTKQPGALHV